MVRHILLLISLLFCTTLRAIKPEDIRGFRHLTVEEGLPHSVVYCLMQDSFGILWIGTKNGLAYYDGHEITTIKSPQLQPTDGERMDINCLLEDHNGNLWIGTSFHGLFLYDRQKETFYPIKLSTPNTSSWQSKSITSLTGDQEGNIFIGSHAGLFKITTGKENILKIKHRDKVTPSVLCLKKDNNGKIWVGTTNGLYYLSSKEEQLVPIKTIKAYILDLETDSNHNIWMGTTNGLLCYNRKNGEKHHYNKENSPIKNNTIKSVSLGSDETLWIGSDGAGLYSYDLGEKHFRQFCLSPDNPHSLSNDGVYDIIQDSFGGLWVGTYGGGLNYASPYLFQFKNYKNSPFNKNSLSNNTARAFLEDRNGNFWFGTKGGISVLDPKTNKYSHFSGLKDDLFSNTVLALEEDDNGDIWIGTYEGGISIYDSKTKSVSHHNCLPPTSSVFAFLYDSQGRLWIGCYGKTVIYNPKTRKVQEIAVSNARSLCQDRHGNIWIGTSNGVKKLNQEGIILDEIPFKKEDPYALNNPIVFCLQEDKKGQMWFGTEGGGLHRLNKNRTFQVYTEADGLAGNIIYGIEENNHGRLWISTTKGLSCFNPELETFENFDENDDLQGREFNYGAHGKTSSGHLVFGGPKGFSLFHPDSLKTYPYTPSVKIMEVRVNNRLLNPGKNGEVNLVKSRNNLEQITLPYNHNNFSFSFTGVDYRKGHRLTFAFQLKGFDNEWTEGLNIRSAHYTNIPPGEYQFEVKATHSSKEWSPSQILKVTVLPPWWLHPAAFILYAILLFLMTGTLMFLYRSRIEKIHAKKKIRFFTQISHELRTPLTLILGPLNSALKSKDLPLKTYHDLELASRNAQRLQRLFNQLLDFQKAENKKMPLHLTTGNFSDFINQTVAVFLPLSQEKGITLKTLVSETDNTYFFDKDKWEKILYNLLSNAFKFTPSGGRITVDVKYLKQGIQLSIKDTGEGISPEELPEIFKRFYQVPDGAVSPSQGTGIGLTLTKHLISVMRGSIKVESTLGKGTCFIIIVPLKTAQTEVKSRPTKEDLCQPEMEEKPKLENKNLPLLLVVEDEPDMQKYLDSILSDQYTITTANNGEEALELAHNKIPDLVISDVMMAQMDGFTLCQKLKEDMPTAHIPIILLTALHETEYQLTGMKALAESYIAKPFDDRILLAQVNSLLTNRKRIQKRFSLSDPKTYDTNPLDQEFIKKAISIINEKGGVDTFDVDAFVNEMGMSRAVAYRKLKAVTGMTVQTFIKEQRLERATVLLKRGDLNISQVAFEVGFSNAKFFSTAFKKKYGCSPSEFIRS